MVREIYGIWCWDLEDSYLSSLLYPTKEAAEAEIARREKAEPGSTTNLAVELYELLE